MKRDFKALLRKFCLETSILGLKYFYLYPDRLSRCYWSATLVFILCSGCLVTVRLHNRFLEMPTRISIENQYEPAHNLSFPAITVCSPNQITITAVKHLNRTLVDGNRSIDLNIIMPQLLGFYELLADVNTEGLEALQNLITINRYNPLEIMGMMPQECDEFLRLCYWRQQRFPCGELFNPILTKHGMCCIFNSVYYYHKYKRNERKVNFEPLRLTNMYGSISKTLTVVADYNPANTLRGSLLLAGAIRVMFTDWTEFPADDESSLVHPYTESMHIIHPTYTYCSEDVTALPSWSRKCYFEAEHSLSHFHGYHNSDCDLLCRVQELERLCRCTMLYVPSVRFSRACNFTSIDCIVQAKMQRNKRFSPVQCDCPRDCVSMRYRADLNDGNLDALQHMIRNPYADIKINKSTSILHFTMPSPAYVKQKQETVMSLISLASNLGGVFGLCLGCSVISVVEIYFFLYLSLKNKIKEICQGGNARVYDFRH